MLAEKVRQQTETKWKLVFIYNQNENSFPKYIMTYKSKVHSGQLR